MRAVANPSFFTLHSSLNKSERGDSNSRPPRPERGTLPTALLSEGSVLALNLSNLRSKATAKILQLIIN